MRERLIAKGAAPERDHRDPELGRHRRRSCRGPRDNEWAREQELDDRFVVMHSGNVGHAQNLDNLVRATTFLRDLDDLVGPDRRLRRAPCRGERSWPSGSRRTRCASCRTSRASVLPRVARQRARALRRAREGSLGLRRPEPPLRDPRGGAAGDRGRGRRQRDGATRRRGRLRRRRPARSARPARRRDPRRARRAARPRGDGARGAASTSSARPTARSRSRRYRDADRSLGCTLGPP